MKLQVIVVLLLVWIGTITGAFADESARKSGVEGLKIAYNVLHNKEADDYEIFVINPDGTGKKNISNWKGVDWVYYASEDKLYFVSDRDTTHRSFFIYEMDANGNNVKKISPFRVYDSWMGSRHNRQEFVATKYQNKKKSLVLIDRNGKELKTLIQSDSAYYNDPCFSPDGKQIVFRYKPIRADTTTFDELWMMNDDGTGLKRLTDFPREDTLADRNAYHAGPPFWESNRNIISYMSFRKGNYSIFSISPDGSGLRQLTPDGFNEGFHTWSPDGNFITYDGSDLDNTNFDIYLMNADGSNVRRLTTDPLIEQCPVFVRAVE